MGIYIPNISKPDNCDACPCWHGDLAYCRITHTDTKFEWDDEVGDVIIFPSDCPIVEVSGRLIDKDALERDISESVVFSGRHPNPEMAGANKIINRIHAAPVVVGDEV